MAQIGEEGMPPHEITNMSGHYEPPASRTALTLGELKSQGVDTSIAKDRSIR